MMEVADNKNLKKITVNGTEYTLQKMYPRPWLQLQTRIKNKYGIPIEEKLYDEIFKHVVVEPKVSLDDFTDFNEVEEIVAEAVRFQRGSEE